MKFLNNWSRWVPYLRVIASWSLLVMSSTFKIYPSIVVIFLSKISILRSKYAISGHSKKFVCNVMRYMGAVDQPTIVLKIFLMQNRPSGIQMIVNIKLKVTKNSQRLLVRVIWKNTIKNKEYITKFIFSLTV